MTQALAERAQLLIVQATVFVVILMLVWLVGTLLTSSGLIGFALGLVAATFATGAATLVYRSDGSMRLERRR